MQFILTMMIIFLLNIGNPEDDGVEFDSFLALKINVP